MTVLLEWPLGSGTMSVEIDCAEEQVFEDSSELTEKPVEQGSNITDHVRPTPNTITITGTITNQPVLVPTDAPDGAIASRSVNLGPGTVRVQTLGWPAFVDRARSADALLLAAQQEGTLVKLTTSLRVVESMVIQSYKPTRTALTGDALSFTLTLKRLVIVSTVRVPVTAPTTRRGQSARDRGAQSGATTDRRSALARGVDGGVAGVRSLLGGLL